MVSKEDYCSLCGGFKRVASRNPTLCFNCYGKQNREECSICHSVRTVNTRDLDGYSICQECNRKKGLCSNCNKVKVIKFHDVTVQLCGSCRSSFRLESCSICGMNKPVICRGPNREAICEKCYTKPKEICCKCGKLKSIKARKNGPTCEACHKSSKLGTCDICKEEKPLNNVVNGNKVCGSCYHKNRKTICARCKKFKIIVSQNKEGDGFWCIRCYRLYRMKTDPIYRLRCHLRHGFKNSLISYYGSRKLRTSKYIDFKRCIERLGQRPDDGYNYHIDHIFPLIAFDFSNKLEIRIAWCADNLQWLRAKDNLKKSGRFNSEKLEEFKIAMIQKYNNFTYLDGYEENIENLGE